MDKPMLNIVTVGHVDHGKSTLMGRLLYERGEIPENVIEKLRKEAESIGKKTFEFAYIFDKTKRERETGVTIEIGFRGFETEHKRFNIIDAPGHKNFIKNMITGAAMADVALLVVDAYDTYQKELMPQTKEHALLVYTLGVERIIGVINKMDKVSYSEEVYKSVIKKIKEYLEKIGYKIDSFVPVSAYYGENVIRPASKMNWYDGPPLIEILDKLETPKRPTTKPFRLPILRTFRVSGIGTVIAGKIETGRIKIDDEVAIVPYPGKGHIKGRVKSIEWQHNSLQTAEAGMDVGIAIGNMEKGFVNRQVKRGFVLSDPNNLPPVAYKFKAKIFILNHPTSIREGYSPTLHCHQAIVPCRFTKIENKINLSTGEVIENNPEIIKSGEGAIVWIKPMKPLIIEEVDNISRMGRFVIRDMGMTIGVGMCLKVIPENKERIK